MLATLDVPYVDTRATDLVWTLNHPVLPALAMVTASRTAPGGTLELRVLGASHQVVLHDENDDISDIVETVACLPGHRPHLPGSVDRNIGGRRYEFRAGVEYLSVDDVRARAHELRRLADDGEPGRAAVVAAFPDDPDALTALATFTARPHGTGWRTWHLYPNSRQVVTTSTEVVR